MDASSVRSVLSTKDEYFGHEAMAADGNPAVQMVLPIAEMVGWLREGVGALIRTPASG